VDRRFKSVSLLPLRNHMLTSVYDVSVLSLGQDTKLYTQRCALNANGMATIHSTARSVISSIIQMEYNKILYT